MDAVAEKSKMPKRYGTESRIEFLAVVDQFGPAMEESMEQTRQIPLMSEPVEDQQLPAPGKRRIFGSVAS